MEVITKLINTITDEEIDLSIVISYDIPAEYSIINYESATGNSGTSFHNGRVQENIPVNCRIFADSKDELNNYLTKLYSWAESGAVVEFIKPIGNNNRSNKYQIRSITPSVGAWDKSVDLSINFSEYRQANVKTIKVNLVGFESAERMRELYNQRIGLRN